MVQDGVIITFTDAIAAAVLDINNWWVRHGDVVQGVTNASIFEGTVSLLTLPGVADPGPDVVTFSPPPFDVVSNRTGLAAQAFSDFPLT